MVMATDILNPDQDSENEEREDVAEAGLMHEQLVRHVLAVSGELYSRSEIWCEHSYAKARGPSTNSQIRSLLPEPETALDADDFIDVETEPRLPPVPPLDYDDDNELEEPGDEEDGEWEGRVTALAPSTTHAQLATVALSTLRDLRLERLAGARGRWARRESTCAAARRLRRALAPHWSGAAAWLHAALLAYLPPHLAELYSELVTELRRAVPRLAERLPTPALTAPYVDPLLVVDDRRDAGEPGPWLAWAPSGSEAEDERWVRRLGALLHTRVLRTSASPPPAPASPDRWCAALAHDARTALADMLIDAGRRAVILGGCGAGAALATWLAAGGGPAARVRGLLLLAPPLLTAEGPRDRPDDVLEEVDVPLLAVVGGGAAQSWRGAAARVAAGGAGGERRHARRVLLVARADDALRLPRKHRRKLALPQQALDAAIAEEGARWAGGAAEARARRRREAAEARAPPAPGNRSIEIIEGRVVTRVSGGSPLALMPPRRSPRPDALAAADIMQLPIVFADDEPARARPAFADDEPLTVTSGGAGGEARRGRGGARPPPPFPRVLVAKRGALRGSRPIMLRRRAPPAPPH